MLLVTFIFAWQPAQAKDEPEDDGDNPELLTEYNAVKKKERNNADIILPLLRKAKQLREE